MCVSAFKTIPDVVSKIKELDWLRCDAPEGRWICSKCCLNLFSGYPKVDRETDTLTGGYTDRAMVS
jgi:hypothetical protein